MQDFSMKSSMEMFFENIVPACNAFDLFRLRLIEAKISQK
jgi:hypothetical protein